MMMSGILPQDMQLSSPRESQADLAMHRVELIPW